MKEINILIVEDEVSIRDMIQYTFTKVGFAINEASNVKEAIHQINHRTPDLILLDWMLPGTSGIEFVKQLKCDSSSQYIPIIILTARAEEENKITGLNAGADDYITKPFSPRELVARVKSVLRRGTLVTPSGIIQIKQMCLNINIHELTIEGHLIPLTPTEYKLLHFFVTHPDRVYTREQLQNHIWGRENYIDDRTVDVQIKRLRKQLKPFHYDTLIQTVRGSGYQFKGFRV